MLVGQGPASPYPAQGQQCAGAHHQKYDIRRVTAWAIDLPKLPDQPLDSDRTNDKTWYGECPAYPTSARQRLLLTHALHDDKVQQWSPRHAGHQGQCGPAPGNDVSEGALGRLFCRVLLVRCPADVLDRLGRTGLPCLRFLFHFHSPTGHYDELEILSYAMPLVCPMGADVRQAALCCLGINIHVFHADDPQTR